MENSKLVIHKFSRASMISPNLLWQTCSLLQNNFSFCFTSQYSLISNYWHHSLSLPCSPLNLCELDPNQTNSIERTPHSSSTTIPMSSPYPNPVKAPEHIHALLRKLHQLSLDQEAALNPQTFKFVLVEAGTGYGVSTIYLALAVGENMKRSGNGGKVVATEKEEEKAEKARTYWRECGRCVEEVVELRVGDLRETLKKDLPAEIDLLLLDSKFCILFEVFCEGLGSLFCEKLPNIIARKSRKQGLRPGNYHDMRPRTPLAPFLPPPHLQPQYFLAFLNPPFARPAKYPFSTHLSLPFQNN
jgi:hypothetical protein